MTDRSWVMSTWVVHALILVVTAGGYLLLADRLEYLPAFDRLFLLDWIPAAAAFGILLLVPLVRRPLSGAALRLAACLDRHPRRAAICTLLVTGAGAGLIYRGHPLSMDEYAAVFQSQVFAAGDYAGRMPTDLLDRLFSPGFLGFFFKANAETGQVVSNYWPGFSLLMTPFTLAGVPWLVNPVLGALCVIALHRLARQVAAGPQLGGWAVLLLLASPMFIVTCMSFYAMPAHLLANICYASLLIDERARRPFAAGLVGSVALLLHHPYPHALFAIPWIIHLLRGPNRQRDSGFLLAGYLAPLAVIGLPWLWVNRVVAAGGSPGSAMNGPVGSVMQRVANLLSFIFTWPTAETVRVRAIELAKLFIWVVPGLPALAWLGLRKSKSTGASLLAASAVLTLIGYLPVAFSQGHGWGHRYFFPALAALPILGASYITSGREADDVKSSLLPTAGALALSSMLLLNAATLLVVNAFVGRHVAQLPETPDRGEYAVMVDITSGYYMSDLIQNDPFLRSSPVILAGQGLPEDSVFMASHFGGAEYVSSTGHGTIWRLPARQGR